MKDIIYSTELKIDGPWLINKDALSELGTIIDESWHNLNQRKSDIINERVKKYLEEERKKGRLDKLTEDELKKEEDFARKQATSWYRTQDKNIIFKLGRDKTYATDSISTALKEQALINEEVTGLDIKFGSAEILAEVSVDKDYEKLLILTQPEREDASKELFVRLREWAIKYRAPIWQRLWKQLYGMQWFILLGIIILSSILVPDSNKRIMSYAKNEAQKILSDGVEESEIKKAIELLLIIQSKYSPNVEENNYPMWFKLLVWVGIIVSVILSFRPKLIIGIGKGNEKLKLWTRWLRFISITIPGLIFGSIIWPYVSEWVLDLLR
jgi:hypothetical protein